METIIQAGNKRLRITSVPIVTNPKTRESRLFRNIGQHMLKSGQAILRSYIMYKPHTVFATLATILGIAGLVPFARFLYFWSRAEGDGHVQSLVFGTTFFIGSLICLALLVIADMQRSNRALLEETLERVKTFQYPPGGEGQRR
jgi:predicted membrane-bound spermidine synthase